MQPKRPEQPRDRLGAGPVVERGGLQLQPELEPDAPHFVEREWRSSLLRPETGEGRRLFHPRRELALVDVVH